MLAAPRIAIALPLNIFDLGGWAGEGLDFLQQRHAFATAARRTTAVSGELGRCRSIRKQGQ